MAKTRDRITDTAESVRPYVERAVKDEEVRENLKSALLAARNIYDELIGGRSPQALATRVAKDKDIQDELRKAVEELRKAGERAQGKESHTGRNFTLLLVGITLGVLFNPATGPDTRRWLKDKVLGPEQPFESQSNES